MCVVQARRQLHTFKPSQLAAVLAALASYPPGEGAPASTSGWHPGRLFLFDFISASAPPGIMQAWSGHQAAQVLWAFSRFRCVRLARRRWRPGLAVHSASAGLLHHCGTSLWHLHTCA
jgi:hypothetical protein